MQGYSVGARGCERGGSSTAGDSSGGTSDGHAILAWEKPCLTCTGDASDQRGRLFGPLGTAFKGAVRQTIGPPGSNAVVLMSVTPFALVTSCRSGTSCGTFEEFCAFPLPPRCSSCESSH